MKTPLITRIVELQAELEAVGNPAQSICISPQQMADICKGLELTAPQEGITEFLGMSVTLVPDFVLMDGAGKMHVP